MIVFVLALSWQASVLSLTLTIILALRMVLKDEVAEALAQRAEKIVSHMNEVT